MANIKISDLSALEAQPSTDDYFVIVDTSEAADADKTKKIDFGYAIKTYVTAALAARSYFVPLTTPLTSTAWDGDSFSPTGKTLIDLSAVFGVPAGVKAVLVKITVRDSASASVPCVFELSGLSYGSYYSCTIAASPINDRWGYGNGIVPCDANGDIYYRINASGSNTMDVYLEIWGYWL